MAIGTPTERYAQELSGQTGSSAINPASTVAASSVAILMVGSGSNKTVTSVTDSVGNTWAVDKTVTDGTRAMSIISCQVATQITSSDTITINYSNATSSGSQISLQEITGLATSSAFDTFATNTGTGTALSAGPSATLAQADEIVIGCFKHGNATIWTKGASYTNFTTPKIGAGSTVTVQEYKIVSNTTAVTADGTAGTSASWSGLVATYKGAAAATTKHNLALLGVG